MSAEQILHDEEAEAQAFNRRIEERVEAGFVPDLRRAVKCEYFYKSFWRDPQFIKLYVGEIVNTYLRMLGHYGGAGLRILDVGCGAGYVSLELARAGHQVIAIDIAGSCIEIARETLAQNPFKDGFGSLEYHVMPFHQASGVYDVILFSGSLHHFDDPDEDVRKGCELLVPGGLILCHEPCHEKWRMEDAAQVALIRTLLSLTGHWYEPFIDTKIYRDYGQFEAYVGDIHTEYGSSRTNRRPQVNPPMTIRRPPRKSFLRSGVTLSNWNAPPPSRLYIASLGDSEVRNQSSPRWPIF